MKIRQKLFNAHQHELIQDVTTRWNSTQLMMVRLHVVEQIRVLNDIMLDPSCTKKQDMVMLLKDHECDVMSDVSAVLKDFSNVKTYMSTEQHISTS